MPQSETFLNSLKILITLVACTTGSLAIADQPATGSPTPELEPLARHVPIEASFYARFSDRARWRSLLGNRPLSGEISDSLAGIDRQGLLSELDHIAVAARTWRDHAQAVIVCQPADPKAFAKKLGVSGLEPQAARGAVRRYKSSRLWVATNDKVFIISEFGDASTMFMQAEALLADGGQSLLDDEAFQTRLKHDHSQGQAGLLYVGPSWQMRQGLIQEPRGLRPAWLPDLDSVMVRFYIDEGAVRCAIVGVRQHPELPLPNAIHPAQLKLLPNSTLAAWSQLFDTEGFVERLPDYLSRKESRLYWHLVQTVLNLDYTGTISLREVGPRCTVCILSATAAVNPHIAMILEAPKAAAVADTLAQAFKDAMAMLEARRGAERSDEVPPAAIEYKGFRIHRFTLQHGSGVFGLWEFSDLQPVIFGIGDQLIIATDAIVARKIIDTHKAGDFGRAVFSKWARASQRGGDDTHIRVFADLAGAIGHLARWEPILARDESFTGSDWFQGLTRYWNDSPVQLGARLRNEVPGKVLVIRVLEDRPAYYARLRPNDLIVGIDGELLNIEDAMAELKRRLTGGRHTLRVERHGRIHELEVDLPRSNRMSLKAMLLDTGKAIHHLKALGNTFGTVLFKQFGTDPALLQAELTLTITK